MTTDNIPLFDRNPETLDTFMGTGDYCDRCGQHGNDHMHVKIPIEETGWLTHHYICPPFNYGRV